MKHYFDINGIELSAPPDPFHGRSPMHKPDGSYNDEAFVAMGGTITDDGQPTPEQAVCGEFAELIQDLASKTDKITPEDQQKVNTARRYLKHIHFNGTLFTERLEYDIGHRAAGKNEINLHNQLRALRSLVKQFANVTSNEYMTKIGA